MSVESVASEWVVFLREATLLVRRLEKLIDIYVESQKDYHNWTTQNIEDGFKALELLKKELNAEDFEKVKAGMLQRIITAYQKAKS